MPVSFKALMNQIRRIRNPEKSAQTVCNLNSKRAAYIRERLVQLLALKPFKKPELYTRLTSEGITDKERSLVNKILPQICSLKDNCYHLRRHMWNDVKEDWPFYSEEEKHMLKRRKPQNLTPPLSSDSAHSLSPRASPGPGAKRPSANGAPDELPSKKQRISHYRRPSPPSSGYATTSFGERHASDKKTEDGPAVCQTGYTAVNGIDEVPSLPAKSRTAQYRRPSPPAATASVERNPVERHPVERLPAEGDDRTVVKDMTNTDLLENTELSSVAADKMNDTENIERQYPPITSSSTRRAYKNEFSELYKEYRSLYECVAKVAALFTRLEQQLQRAQPHSPDQQSIEQRIRDEYRRVSNDPVYQHQRRRFNFLHRKLTHIKQMVHQFDHLTAPHLKDYGDMPRNLKTDRVATASTTQAY